MACVLFLQQLTSLERLVDVLVKEYNLNLRNDVYAHGAIARKEASEGAQLLQYLFRCHPIKTYVLPIIFFTALFGIPSCQTGAEP